LTRGPYLDKLLKINILIYALIKRGGGTGPMKPGNRLVDNFINRSGANSCRRGDLLKDKRPGKLFVWASSFGKRPLI
jgi:hypothetical protein